MRAEDSLKLSYDPGSLNIQGGVSRQLSELGDRVARAITDSSRPDPLLNERVVNYMSEISDKPLPGMMIPNTIV
jgi:hypothetical protein